MIKQKAAFLYPFAAIVLWAGNVIASRLSAHTIGRRPSPSIGCCWRSR
ncbi:hypothetical protein [Pseudaminobacter soli (ex Li et al. 2025)]|nr:hypothetical protein [Mesorhizobium soli]